MNTKYKVIAKSGSRTKANAIAAANPGSVVERVMGGFEVVVRASA